MYKIKTEYKNFDEVLGILKKYTDGFDCSVGTGYWVNPETGQLYNEPSLSIEIGKVEQMTVHKICEEIKKLNKQDTVLYFNFKQVKEHWV